MDYQRLSLTLARYGRDTGFAYVSDSYRRDLRSDPKYRQWRRLMARVSILAMDPPLRRLLNAGLELRAAATVAAHSRRPLEETPFGKSLLAAHPA